MCLSLCLVYLLRVCVFRGWAEHGGVSGGEKCSSVKQEEEEEGIFYTRSVPGPKKRSGESVCVCEGENDRKIPRVRAESLAVKSE